MSNNEEVKDSNVIATITPAVEAPKAEEPKAEEPKQKMPQVKIAHAAKAVIEWYDNNGKVIETELCHRGFFPLFIHLLKKSKAKPELLKSKVSVYLKAENDDKARLVMSEGILEDVLKQINSKIILPDEAMAQLQVIISQMCQMADMRGILITAVFGPDDPGVGGFGFISDCTPVENGDITALATAAAGHLEMFKERMRKERNMTFEGDSKIILPTGVSPASTLLTNR